MLRHLQKNLGIYLVNMEIGTWGNISLISEFGEAKLSICCRYLFQTEWYYMNFLFKWLLMALIQNWLRIRGRVCPRFPLHLDCLVIQNSTHATVLGKEITIMKLGEASKRMHDPNAFLVSHFAQEKAKLNNTHEDFPDDSMYREFVDFRQALDKIIDPKVKYHVLKYQKEIKETTLCKRRSKFEAEDKIDRENMEREAKTASNNNFLPSIAVESERKAIIETHGSGQSSQDMEVI